MTKQTIISLMKVVPCVARAEEFLDGKLYCNTVGFLRCKFDEYEGSVPLTGTLRINDYLIPEEDLSERPRMMPNIISELNVFCMFAWASPNVGGDRILFDPESQLGSIKDLMKTFGEHTVVIKNVTEFFRRADNAVKTPYSCILRYVRGLVEYVEPTAGCALPATLGELMKVALRKQKRFANEKEYRFVYLTGREPAGPIKLNIGDIRDIAFRMRTQDIYDRSEVNGQPLSNYQ